jgi:hypothetical protein
VATVTGVVNFRVKPGRYTDLLDGIKTAQRIVERLGAMVAVRRQFVGAETGNIVVVAQYPDWATYAKAASDPELAGVIDSMRNNPNPAWESIATAIYEEVAL